MSPSIFGPLYQAKSVALAFGQFVAQDFKINAQQFELFRRRFRPSVARYLNLSGETFPIAQALTDAADAPMSASGAKASAF
jgi:hypothetical protein